MKIDWITYRKPDKRDYYLVTVGWEGVRHTDMLLFNPQIGSWQDSEGWLVDSEEILAWAPMPEPWEG